MSSHSIYICMLHRVSMPKVSSTLHFGQPISDTCNFWSFWSQVSWGSECAVLCNFWCAPCCMLQSLILCVMMFAAFCCDHRHELWVCGHKWSAPPREDLGWQEEIWASWTWRGWRWNERACRDLSSSFSVQSAWVHLHTSGWELHNPVSISNTCKHHKWSQVLDSMQAISSVLPVCKCLSNIVLSFCNSPLWICCFYHNFRVFWKTWNHLDRHYSGLR